MLSVVALTVVQTPFTGFGKAPVAPILRRNAALSLANVKQIALATLMYAQDHAETLPRASSFRSDVAPYLKSLSAFTAPGGKTGSVGYFLDPRLSGGKLMKYPLPAETAEILEGAGGKLAFPYGGFTVVGYVDGHAKIASPARVAAARKVSLK